MAEERVTGTVKWFDATKGFGFIVYNGQDVFFHHSDIKSEAAPTLDEGQEVLFTYWLDKGKPKAKNVTDVEGNPFPQTHPTRTNPAWLKRLSENTILKLGRCKWFDCKKGYGFIEPEDQSGEVFVHNAEINSTGFRALRDGDAVEYALEIAERNGKMQRQAKQVTAPGGSPVTYVNPNYQQQGQQQNMQNQGSIFGDVVSYAAVPADSQYGGGFQVQQQGGFPPAAAAAYGGPAYDPYGGADNSQTAKYAAAQTSAYAAATNGARVNVNTGAVKWYAHDKGYGFISGSDGREYFVHKNSLQMQGGVEPVLIPNDSVEFYVEIKGAQHRAVNVTGPRGALLGRNGSGVQAGAADAYGGGSAYDAYSYDAGNKRKADSLLMPDSAKRAQLSGDMYQQQNYPAGNQAYRPPAAARPGQAGPAAYQPYDMASNGYGAAPSGPPMSSGSVSYAQQQSMYPYA